jgi:hypothetical protein
MNDMTPGSMEGGRKCISRDYTGPKKFAEPVSLPSTDSADLPLPGTAFGTGFVLLALRARRKQHTNVWVNAVKGSKQDVAAICALFLFQHFHSQSSSMWTAMWKGSGADRKSFERPLQLRRSNARRH